jgi:hypothetical protein
MAIDYITIKDSSGNPVKVAVDIDGSTIGWQVFKLAFGTLDSGFTAVDAANPLPVIVDATNPLIVKGQRSATAAQSSVASSATNVTLLASNASRLGATVYNDSTAVLYLKLGATASTSSYTIPLLPADYFEVPFGYTGIIDGIWASANGNARITELT